MFLFTSFTANIVALLQSTTNVYTTITDLQKKSIEIGVHDTPFNRHHFAAQTEPIRKKLYDTRIDPVNGKETFMNLTHGISRVRQGMFAFHVATEQGYDEVERTFFENEKCNLVEINYLGNVDTWTVIQKHSPYKEILKVGWVCWNHIYKFGDFFHFFFVTLPLSIMKIREHGVQTRERARIYRTRPKCEFSDGKNFGSVRVIDCYAAVLMFAYGLLLSFFIFCCEVFMRSKYSKMFPFVTTYKEKVTKLFPTTDDLEK